MASRVSVASVAKKAAKRAQKDLVGFDPLVITGIISSLLQIFAACKNRESPETTPAAFLADYYDPGSDTFDAGLVKRARPRTRKAARKQGQPKMSPAQLDTLTVAAFREAMAEQDQTALSAVCAAVKEEA